jgi:hypothetical protein
MGVQELREQHDEEAFEAAASAAAWKAQVLDEHAATSAAKEVRTPLRSPCSGSVVESLQSSLATLSHLHVL